MQDPYVNSAVIIFAHEIINEVKVSSSFFHQCTPLYYFAYFINFGANLYQTCEWA